ncbi:MAG: DUF2778 domain-containing protein [Hyphomicrobiaceae bacterium]|nr:MAG: DUF2778 domain-containing protein [Hyphomicrobiaceae bacterium]
MASLGGAAFLLPRLSAYQYPHAGVVNHWLGHRVPERTPRDCIRRTLLASVASLLLLPAHHALAEPPQDTGALPPPPMPSAATRPAATAKGPSAAASQIADIFSKVGDQIYEDCIFELSEEQVEVQHALIEAYIAQGADSALARQLAVKQISPPKLSAECEEVRRQPPAAPSPWETTLQVEKKPQKPKVAAAPKLAPVPKESAAETPAPAALLAALKDTHVLPQWDCAPNVDFVTISLNGFKRKLTGGEICNPYQDVVHQVPASAGSFRLGYTIRSGRLFVVSEDAQVNGKTIAWAISGRDVCRNNPDPDCFAARAIGPLPPGEYSFAAEQDRRVSWGPKTKRNVAGIWLRKLWNKERFSKPQVKAILARGNIAIHVRLKGEMSEACLGLEPKGWAYVAGLIKDGRATGVNVYIDEPHPQIAEAPPVVEGSSFSLTSLFK